MNDKIFEQLEKLSSAIGVGAEKVWGALVMQGWLEMGKNLAMVVLFVWLTYFCAKKTRQYFNDNSLDSDLFSMWMMAGAIISSILAAIAFTDLQAPEAYAVSRILEALK
jgi:hypothetical protein